MNLGYREILLSELTARKQSNAKFSLRAFARGLEVSPSQLSGIISGKRNLTRRQAGKLVEKLALSPGEKRSFLTSAFPEIVQTETNQETKRRLLREDEFRVISEWYHFAILHLGEISPNNTNPAWIAKRLGIAEIQALEGLSRLKRLGLVVVHKDGSFKPTEKSLTTTDDIPSEAIKRFHKQNLELAQSKLDTVPIDKREYGAMTISVNPSKLPKLKRMIREFQSRISEELEGGKRKAVYSFSVQLFPLSLEENLK